MTVKIRLKSKSKKNDDFRFAKRANFLLSDLHVLQVTWSKSYSETFSINKNFNGCIRLVGAP